MSQALNNLLTLLNLEKIEEGLFRGQSETWAYVRSSAGKSLDKRCTLQRRPSLQTVWCTHSTAISYALATALNRSYMTLKFCETATASAHAAWRPFRTVSLSFI